MQSLYELRISPEWVDRPIREFAAFVGLPNEVTYDLVFTKQKPTIARARKVAKATGKSILEVLVEGGVLTADEVVEDQRWQKILAQAKSTLNSGDQTRLLVTVEAMLRVLS